MQNYCKNLLKPANPILIQTRTLQNIEMTENTAADAAPDISIGLATPLADYTKLMQEKVQNDEFIEDEILQGNYKKIAAAARDTVWKLLFGETQQDALKAAELLREHKSDACFYGPYEYNEWIIRLRDELLRRKMNEFWREQIVKHELGLCWAKDSDYFDDMSDEEPEAFYRHAGCVAPFGKGSTYVPAAVDNAGEKSLVNPSTPVASPLKISLNTPAPDYTAKLQHQLDVNADDEIKLSEIFAEARQVIWELLFKADTLTKSSFEKAASLLEAYKRDACFYNPYDFNEWIPKVRDELFKRKYFDFWKSVIVDQKCGLCWYQDSDYFDDAEDACPLEFYKSGDALMQKTCSTKTD